MKTIVETLTENMTTGITLFAYKKANGEIRPALGTLSEKIIPQNIVHVGVNNTTRLMYYDMQKKAYRTCKVSSIITSGMLINS